MPDEKYDELLSINEAKKIDSDQDDEKLVKFESSGNSSEINKHADIDEALEDVVLGEVGKFEIDPADRDPDLIIEDEPFDESNDEDEPAPAKNVASQEIEKHLEEKMPENAFEEENSIEGDADYTHGFSIKGTKNWNTTEPYVISLDEDCLTNDYSDLNSTFFIITERIDPKVEQVEIKARIMKYLRNPDSKALQDYTAFVFKVLSMELDKISEYFAIKDYWGSFVYHLGPLNVASILTAVLKNSGIGHCYRHVTGNKIKKIFPEEFIKEKVLQWYEENINVLDLDFDSVYQFNEIKKIVSAKYESIIKVFNKRHYDLNLKIGPGKSISREDLIKLKGESWFGTGNMIVYKRFINRTIFN